MAMSPKPTAERRHRATPRPCCVLEVALVTAAVGAIAKCQDVDRTDDGEEGEEREHTYMIGRMFPFL
jgi:hypothetical protein